MADSMEGAHQRGRTRRAPQLIVALLILLGVGLAAGAAAAVWVSHLLGSTVEHLDRPFAEFDPATFTDALGGVTLGEQHLDEARASAYVRERKS